MKNEALILKCGWNEALSVDKIDFDLKSMKTPLSLNNLFRMWRIKEVALDKSHCVFHHQIEILRFRCTSGTYFIKVKNRNCKRHCNWTSIFRTKCLPKASNYERHLRSVKQRGCMWRSVVKEGDPFSGHGCAFCCTQFMPFKCFSVFQYNLIILFIKFYFPFTKFCLHQTMILF